MQALAGIILLAVIVEGVITYLFGKSENDSREWIKYLSLAFGVAIAIAYQVNIPAMAGLETPFPYVGYIVSGLVIGRGSNYLNDILGKLKSFKA